MGISQKKLEHLRETIGLLIGKTINRKEIDRHQICRRLGISFQTLRNIEGGKHDLKLPIAIALFDMLGISIGRIQRKVRESISW